jgi:diguanylate cyclase (GGDEF)-like protein
MWLEPMVVVGVLTAGTLYAAYRIYRSLRRRFKDLESIYAFTSTIDRTETTDELIEATLRQCTTLFGADLAEVVMSRGVGSTVTSLESLDDRPTKRPAPPAVLAVLGEAAVGQGASVSLTDVAQPVREHYQKRGFSTGLVAMLAGSGGTATMIVVGRKSSSKVGRDEVRLFDTLARQARVAFERVWLVDRLRLEVGQKEHQVLHDSLTGLPNRLHFSIVTEEALRRVGDSDGSMAVLLIDLDRFKEINDTLGHQRGDVLLREMALRLTEATGNQDHLARLGGDEFGVVLSGITGIADAMSEARRYCEVLQRPITTEGLTVEITGSVGIALAPDHGSDGTTLLRRADVAMYEAKERGSSIEVYDPQRDRYSTRRLALAGELRDAVGSGAISVHYQPKARLVDGQVVGIEALSRWAHPDHGTIPPAEFISLAERTGIIRPLTEHVLRTACHDAMRLRSEGHRLSVAINIASSSLMDLEFPDLVALVVGETDIDPQAVILEVTETTMMTDSARARVVLEALDEIGVELSIDDLGTGYSSLSYLSVLPVDEVKIDRSFVTDMANDPRLAKIVTSTTALVHSLDLRVVAEGVENKGTWDLLRQADCDVAQGYYLAKPMDFTDLVAWLSSGSIAEGATGPRLVG